MIPARLYLLIMDMKVAEYQLGIEFMRQIDGVFDDDEAVVTAENENTVVGSDTGGCIELGG